ncbi:MAG TPA: RNB domain-containing ribonuclease [Thermoanaerobaculia bacterium]|jgi:exoribonuclease-2|nr:RNB domain-containing ribonuclease [Thermoanaerobaculia bacterium]
MESPTHNLQEIARRAMIERDLDPDFPPPVLAETAELREPGRHAIRPGAPVRDLREMPWFSIDNDDTRDLDQLTVAEPLGGKEVRVMVAIADVDELVPKESATDRRAAHNTTSVYTPVQVFPMLPERLSTDLTSMMEGEDRLAVVVEMRVGEDGSVHGSEIYRAAVRNHAKLAYNSVAAWLDGHGPLPEPAKKAKLSEQIRLQHEAASRLRERRQERGALRFELARTKPVLEHGTIHFVDDRKNSATELIEDFMIAANVETASFLEARGLPSLRRLVRAPHRWPRIVEIAARFGVRLPEEPDSAALARFLDQRRVADPEDYPELSLSILKLLGSGEYTVDLPGRPAPGHFALATEDYTHSTAPNRRFPDLVIQRLIKAALAGSPAPYQGEELEDLAQWCTRKSDDARRVERQVQKSAAALLLVDRIGDELKAVVTGVSEKGTWVRTWHPRVEGKLEHGCGGLDVGDRIRVKLISVNVERGFIDFAAC